MPHRRSRQHLADKERGQPACALADHAQQGNLEIGLVERLDAAKFLDIFGRFLLNDIDDVVQVDDAFDAPRRIDHRHHKKMMAHKESAERLLVQIFRRRNDLLAHNVAHKLVARRDQQIAEGDNAKEMLIGVDDKNVVHRFFPPAGVLAQITDRLADRHIGA